MTPPSLLKQTFLLRRPPGPRATPEEGREQGCTRSMPLRSDSLSGEPQRLGYLGLE